MNGEILERLIRDIYGPGGLKDRLGELERMPFMTPGKMVDFSGDSAIVGWSSFTNKIIYYVRHGPIVFVVFNLTGASDSNQVTFTLPYPVISGMSLSPGAMIRTRDNSGARTVGVAVAGQGTSICTCFPTPAAGATWTAFGTKEVFGEIFYIAG